MAYEINFCETKEQLKHLGEVVTGKTDGSPTGSDIETSTLEYTGQTRKTLTELESEYQEAIDNAQIENYAGLWPDTGGSANKGETWQTQTGGTPTGQYFRALQNTTVDPVSDDVNWRNILTLHSLSGVTEYQADSIASMKMGITSSGELINIDENQVWETLGYYSKGDGGGARYSTSLGSVSDGFVAHDNGVFTFTPVITGGVLYSRVAGVNGTDDTMAFNAGIEYVSSSDSLSVFSYADSTPVLITPYDSLTFFRGRRGCTISGGDSITGTILVKPAVDHHCVYAVDGYGGYASAPPQIFECSLINTYIFISSENGGKVDIGANFMGCQFDCLNKNVDVRGAEKHGIVIIQSWWARYENLFARLNNGAGITIGKHPDFTFSGQGQVNGMSISGVYALGNGINNNWVLGSSEDDCYGVGLYGTLHGMSFDVTSEGNSGPNLQDKLNYGSYVIDRLYIESCGNPLYSVYLDCAYNSAGTNGTIKNVNFQSGQSLKMTPSGNTTRNLKDIFCVGRDAARTKIDADGCTSRMVKISGTVPIDGFSADLIGPFNEQYKMPLMSTSFDASVANQYFYYTATGGYQGNPNYNSLHLTLAELDTATYAGSDVYIRFTVNGATQGVYILKASDNVEAYERILIKNFQSVDGDVIRVHFQTPVTGQTAPIGIFTVTESNYVVKQ